MRTLDELGVGQRGRLLRARPRRAARAARRRGVPARPRARAAESYLNVEKIIEVAQQAGAEAIHPGYGFLAENAAFARACEEAGIVFIGPPAERDRRDGLEDQGARAHAATPACRSCPAPPSRSSRSRTRKVVIDESIGYPVAIKAAGGGGGKGFRVRRVGGRAREGLRGRRARGREVLLRPHRLRRALPARPAPRRGPGAGRRARQRHPPGRARLLGAAPPPEADRGEPRAGGRPRAARAHRQDRRRGGRGRWATARPARSRACSRTASTSSSR